MPSPKFLSKEDILRAMQKKQATRESLPTTSAPQECVKFASKVIGTELQLENSDRLMERDVSQNRLGNQD